MPMFITQSMHAYLDNPVALGLIIMPFLLGIGQTNPLAFWLSIVTGIAAFALTFLADHHLGVVKVLPFKFHLFVDMMVGFVFVIVPFVLGVSGLDAAYYWVLGATVLVVVSLSAPEEAVTA